MEQENKPSEQVGEVVGDGDQVERDEEDFGEEEMPSFVLDHSSESIYPDEEYEDPYLEGETQEDFETEVHDYSKDLDIIDDDHGVPDDSPKPVTAPAPAAPSRNRSPPPRREAPKRVSFQPDPKQESSKTKQDPQLPHEWNDFLDFLKKNSASSTKMKSFISDVKGDEEAQKEFEARLDVLKRIKRFENFREKDTSKYSLDDWLAYWAVAKGKIKLTDEEISLIGMSRQVKQEREEPREQVKLKPSPPPPVTPPRPSKSPASKRIIPGYLSIPRLLGEQGA